MYKQSDVGNSSTQRKETDVKYCEVGLDKKKIFDSEINGNFLNKKKVLERN